MDDGWSSSTIVDMQLQSPLRTVTPTSDGAVLEVLARANAAFTPPQLHAVIGRYSVEGLRKALRRLVAQGIVTEDRSSRGSTYRLNRRHLVAGPVIEMARIRETLLTRMRDHLERWLLPPSYAALFGSAARGTMDSKSDIDVLVVRPDDADDQDDLWDAQIDGFASEVTALTGNDARLLEYGGAELVEAVVRGDRVLATIADEGICLAGPSAYLRRARQVSA